MRKDYLQVAGAVEPDDGLRASSDQTGPWLLPGFGLPGYLMRKMSVPIPPLILAIALSDLLEKSLRQSITISGGDPAILVGSPIAVTLLIMSVIIFFGPFVPWRQLAARASSWRKLAANSRD